MPCKDSRAQQEEERFLFFSGKDSANEKPWMDSLFTVSPPTSFPPYKRGLPLPCRDLHMVLQDCRPLTLTAILCQSQINPSLLKKYLAVYLL